MADQPQGVRLVAPDGTEYPCTLSFDSTDENGITAWAAVPSGLPPAAVGTGWSLQADVLPARTALLLRTAVDHG